MSHYRSNVSDLEFNLFEVLGAGERMGTGPFAEMDADTARRGAARTGEGRRRPGRRVVRRRRPQPPGVRPGHLQRDVAGVVQEVVPGARRRRVVPAGSAHRPRRVRRVTQPALGRGGADARRQPGVVHVLGRAELRRRRAPQRHPAAAADGRDHDREAVGLDHGADRAGRRQRRRRRPHQGDPAAGRQLASGGRQAVHHLRRIRPGRQHRAPGAGPSGRPRHREPARHQGFEPVHRAEVPVRPGDRRARRAQRRLRHRRGTQDGTEGLDHLRAEPRHPRHAGSRIPVGRQARRHRTDVPGDRVRPDDGRHQGDRHAVHRLPQRAGVRQAAGAERRSDQGERQDRTAGDDHPPPRRPPDADEAEGLRGGPAGRLSVHGGLAGQDRRRRAGGRRRWTSAKRVNDLLLPIVKGVGSERAYENLAPVPAGVRRVRLHPGLPDRAVHPGRQDRHPVRGHHGDPGAGLLLPQDRQGQRGGAGRRRRRRSPRSSRPRSRRTPTAGTRRSSLLLRHRAGRRAGHGRRAGRLRGGLRRRSRNRSTRSASMPLPC